jgi:hypothetical protein
MGMLRLEQGHEFTLRFALRGAYDHAGRKRSLSSSSSTQHRAGEQDGYSSDSEDGDDDMGVFLRVGFKPLNFSSIPTDDDSSDELSESAEEDMQRRRWLNQSSGEIPVVVPSRTKKDKQRVQDSDSDSDNNSDSDEDTSSDLSDQEEEEEQLRQNEVKRLASKLQEGGNFLLVTRKHGVRPSHVRLSGDQRTLICRRHTSNELPRALSLIVHGAQSGVER